MVKIIEFIADKDIFTNDDLEKLLGVSNTTIGRYLDELEKQNKITQVGSTGKYFIFDLKFMIIISPHCKHFLQLYNFMLEFI